MQEETKEEITEETKSVGIGPNRQEDGTFGPGNCANPNGRPKDSEETKIKRKAIKEIVTEYKQNLAESLPLIEPILIKKAQEGDISAIKEIHDRVMDKARQPVGLEGNPEKPIPILSLNNISN